MFDQLVGQVRKLFSSSSNGGRLVYNLADRLHYYKQVLLATSIILLLGYSQFRDHFECQPVGNLDKRTVTNFCWINGTATLSLRRPELAGQGSPRQRRPLRPPVASQQQKQHSQLQQQLQQTGLLEAIASAGRRLIPHVGIHFRPRDGNYELVSHNYMRSLWALLILMAVCSFVAQRKWARLFASSDLLRALLKLPGHADLAQASQAQKVDAYRTLMRLPVAPSQQAPGPARQKLAIQLAELSDQTDAELARSLELLSGEANEHDRSLDYYPNQLIYLLVARSPDAQRLCDLRLRARLVWCSVWSCALTFLQFALPWLFIGNEYLAYGLSYARVWLAYVQALVGWSAASASQLNSIDYDISSRVWPTVTHCRFSRFGAHDVDSVTIICLVPINEICAKLFAVIWWFVVVNMAIELVGLAVLLGSSLNAHTIEWTFGRRFWPAARAEAKQIATFRRRQALLLAETTPTTPEEPAKAGHQTGQPEASRLSAGESKRLEAQADAHSGAQSFRAKKWYLWCTRDVGLFLADKGKRIRAGQRVEPEEPSEDINVYYLLRLLYFRLDCSQRKVEQVTRMTNCALAKYLDSIQRLKEGKLNLTQTIHHDQQQQHRRQHKSHRSIKSQELAQATGKTKETIIDVML